MMHRKSPDVREHVYLLEFRNLDEIMENPEFDQAFEYIHLSFVIEDYISLMLPTYLWIAL